MAFVRCYTGTDGQSRFEDLDLLPPDMERSIEQAASSITFTRSPNGRFSDWHNAPRRQYAIFPFQRLAQCAAPPVRHFPLRRRDGGRDRRWHHPAVRPWRRRPVRRPHRTRAHQPERRWGPPERYRALSGLASARGCVYPMAADNVHPENRVAHACWKRLIGQGVYHTSKGPTVGRAKGRGRGQQPSRKLEGEKHG